jgi:hypothetical protein
MPEVHDSPNAWVTEHIRRFEETGGRPRPGVNDLLLTTRGRKSGELRRTALVYERDSGSYVLAEPPRAFRTATPLRLGSSGKEDYCRVIVGASLLSSRKRP